MNQIIIDLINKFEDWINEDKWEDIYISLYDNLDPKFGTGDVVIGEFTKAMLEARINPLASDLTYVPNYYAYGLTLGKLEFPKNILSISSSAYADTNGYRELYLPGHIDCINEDAFRGSAVYKVEIEEGCIIIGEGAFADCDNLKEITIPASCSFMHDNIFMNSDDVVIRCYRGSRAESYAKEYDIDFEWID